jgi:hypothetical protein
VSVCVCARARVCVVYQHNPCMGVCARVAMIPIH